MPRILLAWELGGNSGHAVRIARIAGELARAGHATSLAVQRPDALRAWRDAPGMTEIRQAPVWPGLLRHAETPPLQGEASWGDLLAGVGMTDSGVLEYLLRCWDRLFADARPDLLVADFAPAALLAARGRLPAIAVGTGFTVPPAALPAFPLLRDGAAAPLIAEDALLRVVNRALWRVGRPPLDRLPRIAEAALACPATFAELDPYRAHRPAPPLPPFLSGDPGRAGAGQEIFAYLPQAEPRSRALAQALGLVAQAGMAVAAVLPGLPGPEAAALARAGVRLHPAAVPQAEIAARSRLLVATGGLGATSAALAAGLPLALLPVDLEKRLTAEAVAGLGAGRLLRAAAADAVPDLAAQLLAAAADPGIAARAAALAPGFRARLDDPAAIVARHAAALGGG